MSVSQPLPPAPAVTPLNDPHAIRSAGRELLSVALIDSRNHLLQLLARQQSAAALQRAARAGWYQEYWIARHMQRQRGEACDATAPRLAGIEPAAERWTEDGVAAPAQALRAYLQDTLETTLELLAGSSETDAGLCFFRLALQHEDRQCEAMALALDAANPPARPQRPALWFPGQRWQLGSAPGGLVPFAERWAHEVLVPEFEIDAQPVNWQQYVEFADDGGYDRPELWGNEGWAWLQAQAAQGESRRAPRDVEQLRGGVLLLRRQGGQPALQRAAAGQPVLQASRHEAQAWCTWAGRRLPTEPEWELAACTAASRGYAWGDVLEWVAGRARTWPGAGPVPPGHLEAVLGMPLDRIYTSLPSAPPALRGQQAEAQQPASGGVLRGATSACHPRWRHPKARRFAALADDVGPIGFRSCAV